MDIDAAALTRPRALPCAPLNLGLTATGKVLGVSRSRVDQLIKEGKLEAVWLGQRRLVRYASVVAFSESLPPDRPDSE
jgi:excisionase family DNA binding protein